MMLSGKKAYICSPLSAPDAKGISHNMDMARFYMERMHDLYHCRSFASHAYLPLMLDDSIPEEREIALRIGMELMGLCDILIICGRRVSSGMAGEVREAFAKGMAVYWYDSKEKPFELRAVESWREEWDAVQVCK
jgi:hypothetical protein|nr:hypothetical protein [uncultured Schaedlerella sp.]